MASEGRTPLLKKSRWLLLKREENLNAEQRFRLRDLLRYNWKTVPGLPSQGSLPATLGLQLALMGGKVSRRVVPSNHAFPHPAHEEDRSISSPAPGTDPHLLPRQKADFQRSRGGYSKAKVTMRNPEPRSTHNFFLRARSGCPDSNARASTNDDRLWRYRIGLCASKSPVMPCKSARGTPMCRGEKPARIDRSPVHAGLDPQRSTESPAAIETGRGVVINEDMAETSIREDSAAELSNIGRCSQPALRLSIELSKFL